MGLTTPPDNDFIAGGFDASLFMEVAFGMVPDPWQSDFLRGKSD